MRELSLDCAGLRVRLVDTADTGLCARMREILPPGPAVAPGSDADLSYVLRRADPARGEGTPTYRVTVGDRVVFGADTEPELARWLRAAVDRHAAERPGDRVFVHAGVVGWRGRAIVIPGRSGTGKSRLVAELVRLGARYYSDEYAVLDERGRVHPYARALALRDDDGTERLVTVGELGGVAGGEPLPVAVVVSTRYREGAAWRPVTVRGARATLPLVDSMVRARLDPARTMRLAATLAPTVVTLRGPRPDARVAAPRILGFLDGLIDGWGGPGSPMEAEEVADRVVRLLAGHPAGETGQATDGVAVPRLRPARFVRIDGLLDPAAHRRVLDHALAHEADFRASGVLPPDGIPRVAPEHRRSQTTVELDAIWDLFEARLRRLLPFVRTALGMPWFRVERFERQLTAHRDGEFFGPHVDNGMPTLAGRRLTCVYYFHARPRRFSGGELRLYDGLVVDGRLRRAAAHQALDPADNTAIFFPSDVLHEVRPVRCESGELAHARFALNIWCWVGPAPPLVAGRRPGDAPAPPGPSAP